MKVHAPLALSAFDFTNYTSPLIGKAPVVPVTLPITLTALPGTDLWRKPGLITSSHPTFSTRMDLSEFHRARVTFSADWKTLYDQGGLSFLFIPSDASGGRPRWIKAGIEHVGGVPRVSIVASEQGSWSDWSLAGGPEGMGLNETKVTVEMVREGPSLVVNVGEGNNLYTVREVTWVFEESVLDGNPKVLVGAYAAKPTPEEGDDKQEEGIDVVFHEINVWKHLSGHGLENVVA